MGCVTVTSLILAGALGVAGCVQQAPPELVEAVENLDRELLSVRGAEFAPEEYARFVDRWVAVKARIQAEDDVIHWPWEANRLAAELLQVEDQGKQAAQVAARRREAERREILGRLTAIERRLAALTNGIEQMVGSRLVLGQRLVQTELLVKQGRAFFEQGRFARSSSVLDEAAELLDDQVALLTAELGRYADDRMLSAWRRMVRQTVAWSKRHQAPAIVVNKAKRSLSLYRGGRLVVSYPVVLGYNGMLEKRYQGDGATPEGRYRIIKKRDRHQTQFYRALLLDYPNAVDRQRFRAARQAGVLPAGAAMGGQIEIHGLAPRQMSQTLGCLMLENRWIDVLFDAVDIGTPVTIVGALTRSNAVALALAELDRPEEEEVALAGPDPEEG
jgi:hypothetical protein